jgi:non-ribosomal peptide synthetase component F
VPQLVEIQAQRQPMAVAVASDDAQLTYGAFYEKARQIASELARRGVPTGSVVAAYLGRGPHLLATQLGIWLNNCTAFVVDPSLPEEILTARFRDAQPKAIIVGDVGSGLPEGAEIISLNELKDDSWFPANTPEADPTPAYLAYTAGVTGTPKGVLVGHRSLAHLIRWHTVEYAVGSRDRASSLADTATDAFIWETWPYLCSGASVFFAPKEARTSGWDLSDWIVGRDITIAYVPTFLIDAYLEHGSKFEQLRALLTGGDPLRLTGGHPFNDLVNHYGPTEATIVATRMPVDPAATGVIGLGWPLPSVHTLILDDALGHVPVGQTGQLYLGGECLALSYHGNPQLTEGSFIHLDGHPGRWFKTGDLVAIENSGLSIKGRI